MTKCKIQFVFVLAITTTPTRMLRLYYINSGDVAINFDRSTLVTKLSGVVTTRTLATGWSLFNIDAKWIYSGAGHTPYFSLNKHYTTFDDLPGVGTAQFSIFKSDTTSGTSNLVSLPAYSLGFVEMQITVPAWTSYRLADVDVVSDNLQDENTTVEVAIYPVPALDKITIKLTDNVADETAYQLTIYDLFGNQIATNSIYNNEVLPFERNNLAAGMYLYEIKNKNHVVKTGNFIFQ